MSLLKKCTAIRAPLLLALLFVATTAGAETIGTVTDLSGTLLVSRASGSIRVLGHDSALESGDVFATRAGTYATLSLADHTSITLGPDTELAIDSYTFHASPSPGETAVLKLARGRVRIATGILGTRDSDTFTLVTGSGTLDIRRSSLIAEYVVSSNADVAQNTASSGGYTYQRAGSFTSQPSVPPTFNDSAIGSSRSPSASMNGAVGGFQWVQNLPPNAPSSLAPGLYVQVLDGAIHLTNSGGTQNFSAGQFGFTPSFKQPPVILPTNPGMQFTPPPAFSAPVTGQTGTAAPKSGTVDCVVR